MSDIVKCVCQHCQRVTVVPQENVRQLLSEAETREREARAKALEEAAIIVESVSHEGLHNSMWRYRFERVAADIRALQSEGR